jgi:hypothetical protein
MAAPHRPSLSSFSILFLSLAFSLPNHMEATAMEAGIDGRRQLRSRYGTMTTGDALGAGAGAGGGGGRSWRWTRPG